MTRVIRESTEHIGVVRRLTVEAFTASAFGYHGEADLIDTIRSQCDSTISLVAVDDDCVVGHILFSPAKIRTVSSEVAGMGLGPMVVLPSRQNQGVGSMLVIEGLRLIAESDCAFTVVAGHPGFYPRFGFLPAERYHLTHGFAGMPQNVLFIHASKDALRNKLAHGRVYYHAAFGEQHADDFRGESA